MEKMQWSRVCSLWARHHGDGDHLSPDGAKVATSTDGAIATSLMARFGDTPFGHQLEATGSDKRLPASVGDNEGAIATSLMARFWRYARRIIFRCSCSNRPYPLREESCFIPAETAECI